MITEIDSALSLIFPRRNRLSTIAAPPFFIKGKEEIKIKIISKNK